MIVVDSSVWIDFLRDANAPHVRQLHDLLGTAEIIVGDLMLCEVLQGLDSERSAQEVEGLLRRFEVAPMAGDTIAKHLDSEACPRIITGQKLAEIRRNTGKPQHARALIEEVDQIVRRHPLLLN